MQLGGSGRGDKSDGRSMDRSREYETVAIVHHGADVQCSSSSGQQLRTSYHQGYGDGRARTRNDGASGDRASRNSDDRLLSQEYSVSPYGAAVGGPSTPAAYSSSHNPHPHSNTPASSYPDRAADHSCDSLTLANPQYPHSDISTRHSPHHLDLPTPARPRSGSRDNMLDVRTNNGSRNPQKTFEVYPNPYGEPLETGDPLMSRYEDVAMFKSTQDPSSQVSSSTDSGYGHGHHIYERIGDFNARRSGELLTGIPR